MGLAIPIQKIDNKDYVAKINSMKQDALQLASGLIHTTNLVVRPIRPKDLGLSTDEWTFNLSAGSNTVSKELNDKTMIVIYGIYNESTTPVTTEVKFGSPAETKEDVYIEDMYMYDVPAEILENPIVFQPGTTAEIEIIAKGDNSTEKLGFLGFVVEPAGLNIGKR